MEDLMIRDAMGTITEWLNAIPTTSPSSPPSSCYTEVELSGAMSTTTLSIIASCAFGPGFSAIPNSSNIVRDGLERSLAILMRRVTTMVEFIPVIRDLPIVGRPEQMRARGAMKELIDRVIRERREGKTGSTKGLQDLLDCLISARDPDTGEGLTNEELRDEGITLALAGHETTSNLLAWGLYILMTRPQLWAECVEEVRSVCGDQPPLHEHFSQLPIIEAVLNETLRVFAPVPLIGREVVKAHVIGEGTEKPIHVPVGTMIQIAAHILHRLPEYWGNNAGRFDHTRWLKGKRPYSHPSAFIPFSAGPRNCIGSVFAMTEAKVILVLILQHVRMEWVEGQKMDEEDPEFVIPVRNNAITLRPLYDMKVRVYRADSLTKANE